MTTLNDSSIEEKINESDKLIIKFYASWCESCKPLIPLFTDLEDHFSEECNFANVEIDFNPEIIKKYGISSVPIILFLNKGKVVNTIKGSTTKSILHTTVEKFLS